MPRPTADINDAKRSLEGSAPYEVVAIISDQLIESQPTGVKIVTSNVGVRLKEFLEGLPGVSLDDLFR